jgi:exodeoxyribonuclease VII small subunit
MSDLPSENMSFEQALAALEEVVRDLEESGIGLEESLLRYERGVGLIKRCYAQLRQAEQRILLVTGTDSEGKPVLGPFLHSATEPGSADLKRPSSRNQGPNSATPF